MTATPIPEKAKPMAKLYSVIMRDPDYLGTDSEIRLWYVTADDHAVAVTCAQTQAAAAAATDGVATCENDFQALFVFAGHVRGYPIP